MALVFNSLDIMSCHGPLHVQKHTYPVKKNAATYVIFNEKSLIIISLAPEITTNEGRNETRLFLL